MAGQVRPFDGDDAVGHAHQQHAGREPQQLGGGEQQEGCDAGEQSVIDRHDSTLLAFNQNHQSLAAFWMKSLLSW